MKQLSWNQMITEVWSGQTNGYYSRLRATQKYCSIDIAACAFPTMVCQAHV
jgi:hypothetical protein